MRHWAYCAVQALKTYTTQIHRYSSCTGAINESIEVVIALGSNQGHKVKNLWTGLDEINAQSHTKVLRYASLYETAPAYYSNQDYFINTAVIAETQLSPRDLLKYLKSIEVKMGRNLVSSIRYGPRPLDLDIIFYGNVQYEDEDLQIPHPRWKERSFVIAPVVDLRCIEGAVDKSRNSCNDMIKEAEEMWLKMDGEDLLGQESIKRVTPVSDETFDFSSKTHLMGILNITPDSFSDGGLYVSKDTLIPRILDMIASGVDIIDIGGQSTRPGAERISAEEECERVMPVFEMIKGEESCSKVLLSIDTFYADVAREAVNGGARIINDVSSGDLDRNMHTVVSSLEVPYIMMHMRGDPKTMQSTSNTQYSNLLQDIARELSQKASKAVKAGIMPWSIISDPGIGFAKLPQDNLRMLSNLNHIKNSFSQNFLKNAPMLVGASRKGFLGQIINKNDPRDRDAATCAASTVAALNGADIIRVHNTDMIGDAVKVINEMKAIDKHNT